MFVHVFLYAEEPVSEGTTGGPMRPEVPPGAVGEVARVLGAVTHYDVLQVSPDAGTRFRNPLTPSALSPRSETLLPACLGLRLWACL